MEPAGLAQYAKELIATANKICTPGKGILAADESPGSIIKKFGPINLENNAENRRLYREMLLTAPEMEKYISGVILQEETAKQSTSKGTKFIDYLQEKGIVAGIKVDKGLGELNPLGEHWTKGLDSLHQMAAEFYAAGCRFAKWRAALKIARAKDGAPALPTEQAVQETAWTLARYAAICQQHGLVPIVEPEILPDGDHSAEECQKITERVLSAVFKALQENGVLLEGCLLKPNMVAYGSVHPKRNDKASPAEEAIRTVKALSRTVPPALVGVTFLSGGQTEEEASVHLNLMNQLTNVRRPWALTFSFGRALQNSAIKAWAGLPENVAAGQTAFLGRAKANSEAQLGKYQGSTDAAANETLFEASYVY